VTVRFVDIGGIDYHYCLSMLSSHMECTDTAYIVLCH